jgi:hypothetical protein
MSSTQTQGEPCPVSDGHATLRVESEVAYDLIQEHTETLLRLLDSPLPEPDLVAQVGGPCVLERLVRHGLVRRDDGVIRPTADVLHQWRQEGMTSFLRRYVLPTLAVGAEGGDRASLQIRRLRLCSAGMDAVRPGPVQRFLDRLVAISDSPAAATRSRLTVLVVGTSWVQSADDEEGRLPDSEDAIVHLRQACLERAATRNASKKRAVLAQFDFLADEGRYTATGSAIDTFLKEVDALERDTEIWQNPDVPSQLPEHAYHSLATHRLQVVHHGESAPNTRPTNPDRVEVELAHSDRRDGMRHPAYQTFPPNYHLTVASHFRAHRMLPCMEV